MLVKVAVEELGRLKREITLETEFAELKDDTKFQIKVAVESSKTKSKATLRGRVKDEKLSQLFAKSGKSDISFESKWCKTKYPRLSFGKIAVIANQEIAHDSVSYLCQN